MFFHQLLLDLRMEKLQMNKDVILTTEGFKQLKEELEYLIKVRRKEVAARIKQSIEFGDISENSEYDDAKNEQAFVEGKISQIKEMISNAQIIDNRRVHTDKVDIGSLVTLKDMETKKNYEYHLVGFAEADPNNHKISNESPVGKAILGKKCGEVVEVNAPLGIISYRVMKICRNNNNKVKSK